MNELLETNYRLSAVEISRAKRRFEDAVEVAVQQQRQLHMARYAFHKVACARYQHLPDGPQRYALAMTNYDELVEGAKDGAHTDANEADMQKGFPIDGTR